MAVEVGSAEKVLLCGIGFRYFYNSEGNIGRTLEGSGGLAFEFDRFGLVIVGRFETQVLDAS